MDTPASEQTAPERSPLRAAIKTARPHEWVKNVLVFAGLLFSGQVDDPWAVGQALLAFAAFCAISSAGYFINDLNDVELDRAHPKKRFRPIAAGPALDRLGLGDCRRLASVPWPSLSLRSTGRSA